LFILYFVSVLLVPVNCTLTSIFMERLVGCAVAEN